MHDLFYCKLAGDDAERCLALAAALQNAPDFVLLEQVFAPEAAETAALEAAVNRIAEKMFQTAR